MKRETFGTNPMDETIGYANINLIRSMAYVFVEFISIG